MYYSKLKVLSDITKSRPCLGSWFKQINCEMPFLRQSQKCDYWLGLRWPQGTTITCAGRKYKTVVMQETPVFFSNANLGIWPQTDMLLSGICLKKCWSRQTTKIKKYKWSKILITVESGWWLHGRGERRLFILLFSVLRCMDQIFHKNLGLNMTSSWTMCDHSHPTPPGWHQVLSRSKDGWWTAKASLFPDYWCSWYLCFPRQGVHNPALGSKTERGSLCSHHPISLLQKQRRDITHQPFGHGGLVIVR